MMKTTLCVAVLAAATLVAACGDDTSDTGVAQEMQEAVENAPACSDLFAPGRPTQDVLDDAGVGDADGGGLCREGDDTLVTVMASLPCDIDSDRLVHWGADDSQSWGYGVEGESWQAHEDGQDLAPTDIC